MQGEIRRRIKYDAKLRLTGNWGTAIGVILIVGLITFALNLLEQGYASLTGNQTLTQTFTGMYTDILNGSSYYTYMPYIALSVFVLSGVFTLISFLLTTPLQMGSISWFTSAANGTPQGLGALFSWFESGRRYFATLGTAILVSLKTLLFILIPLVIMIPSLFFLISAADSYRDAMMVVSGIFFFVSYIALLILGVYASIRYSFSYYLLALNPELGPNEATKLSAEISKGHIFEAFVFDLSFLGWYLLSGITCGLVALYVTPYQCTAFCLFTRYLHDQYRQRNGMAGGFGGNSPYTMYGDNPGSPLNQFGQNPGYNQNPYQNPYQNQNWRANPYGQPYQDPTQYPGAYQPPDPGYNPNGQPTGNPGAGDQGQSGPAYPDQNPNPYSDGQNPGQQPPGDPQ